MSRPAISQALFMLGVEFIASATWGIDYSQLLSDIHGFCMATANNTFAICCRNIVRAYQDLGLMPHAFYIC